MPYKRNWLGTCTCLILFSLIVFSLSRLVYLFLHRVTTVSFKDTTIIQTALLPLLTILCHFPVQCLHLRALWQATFAEHLSRLAMIIVFVSYAVGGVILIHTQQGVHRYVILGFLAGILLSMNMIILPGKRMWFIGHLFKPFIYYEDATPSNPQSQAEQIPGK